MAASLREWIHEHLSENPVVEKRALDRIADLQGYRLKDAAYQASHSDRIFGITQLDEHFRSCQACQDFSASKFFN